MKSLCEASLSSKTGELTDEEYLERFRDILMKFEKGYADRDSWMFALALEEDITILQAELEMIYKHLIRAEWQGTEKDSILDRDKYVVIPSEIEKDVA